MDIGKFIDNFVEAKDPAAKDRLIKKHIVNNYLEYSKKIEESKKIIKFSLYDTDGNFRIDSTIHYMLFVLAVIRSYTDLEFDNSNTMLQFDLIEKHGVMEYLVNNIKEDYARFSTVLQMVYDDEITNTRSLPSYIEQKAEAIMTVIETLNAVENESKE